MKKFKFIAVILLSSVCFLLFSEIFMRLKTVLHTKDMRWFLYHQKVVFAPIGKKVPLFRSFKFILTESPDKKGIRNVMAYGSSVMQSASFFLEQELLKKGLSLKDDVALYYSSTNKESTNEESILVEYNSRDVVLLELPVSPLAWNFFNASRGPLEKIIGPNLYSNLYFNSVLFLRLSEKYLVPKFSFSKSFIDEFIKETIAVFEKYFQNIQKTKAPILYVIYPNNHLNGDIYFSRNIGIAINQLIDRLLPIIDKFGMKTCNIYKDSGYFSKSDFYDDLHFTHEGGKKALGYIMDCIQKNFLIHNKS